MRAKPHSTNVYSGVGPRTTHAPLENSFADLLPCFLKRPRTAPMPRAALLALTQQRSEACRMS